MRRPIIALIAAVLSAVTATAPSARGNDPFRLYSVRLHARDLEGGPVVGARIYAFNEARMMFGSESRDHVQPAGETDKGGLLELRVPDGSWRVLGVGETASGRAWLVSRTLEIGRGTPRERLFEPDRAVKVERRGFNAKEALELDLSVRPNGWPRWWHPAPLHSPLRATRQADRSIEAGIEADVDLWLHSRTPIDRRYQLARVSFSPKDRAVFLAPAGRDGATIRVVPPKRKRGLQTDVFFVLESLDFRSTRHPFLYYMEDDKVEIAVPLGDYVVRHYVEWITDRGKWHGEFANEHVTLDAKNRDYEYVTTDRFDVRPVFHTFGPRHGQLWLDALDSAGHRLDWFVAPETSVFGQLRIFDENEELTETLDIRWAKQHWLRREGEPSFPTQGHVELVADLELWKVPPTPGAIFPYRRDQLPRVELPHLTIVYPQGATEESAEWLERRALEVGPTMEQMLAGAYAWYGLEPSKGIVVEFHLSSPTAGGSSGHTIILSLDYLLRGGIRTAHNWGTYAHEFGHSMHVVDPCRAFLQRTDRDHIGLFNESQASFMGSKGVTATFGRDDFQNGTAFGAQGFLRHLRGETKDIDDLKSRLGYLCYYFEQELGEEFSRRCFRLALLKPRDVRDRIRARDWSPAEKVAALFSIAAERDLGDLFRSAGFDVGARVCDEALRLAEE